MSGSDLRVHFADRSFLYAVIKIGRQYRLHIFRGASVKYEADLRKAPALSVDQTVKPDGSGINQLLNEVRVQQHQGVPTAFMRKEQLAMFPLEYGLCIIENCHANLLLQSGRMQCSERRWQAGYYMVA